MEAVKNESSEETKKESKLIVVIGLDTISRQFLKEAIVQIFHLSGYSVNAQEFDKPEETDFHVIIADKFNIEIEAKATLVFGAYKNPSTLFSEECNKKQSSRSFGKTASLVGEFTRIQNEMYELLKWMRSSKLAYCMDYDAPMNAKGLHNYNNLNNIIMPLKFTFQRIQAAQGMEQPEPGKKYFNLVDPKKLIEALVPDLAEKSRQASEKFEATKKEKLGEDAGADK